MKLKLTAWILAASMCGAAFAGVLARPTVKGPPPELEKIVPKTFGEWTALRDQAAQIIDPVTKQTVEGIYDEVLTRTYVNKEGYRIMLSIAYGGDQRGVLRAHPPDVCYRSQGFELGTVEDGALQTSFGNIDVGRFTAGKGARTEPVTYWLTIGDLVVRNSIEKRFIQIVMGISGKIPGGLLYRVSSIDKDPGRAFMAQQKFVADMMASVPPDTRRMLSGLKTSAAAGGLKTPAAAG